MIGALLPRSGSLSYLGPVQEAAVAAAQASINAAGGVLGQPLAVVSADSGDVSTDVSGQSVPHLLSSQVTAVVGPSSSAVVNTVLAQLTGAGILVVTPAATGVGLGAGGAGGLFARTTPTDATVTRVLAAQLRAQGARRVGVVALGEAWSASVAPMLMADLRGSPTRVVAAATYPVGSTTVAPAVSTVLAAHPDAVVVVGAGQSAQVVAALRGVGLPSASPGEAASARPGPVAPDPRLFLMDTAVSTALYASLPTGTLAGAVGIAAGPGQSLALRTALAATSSGLTAEISAPETYDAVVLVALAAQQTASVGGVALAAGLRAVTTGQVRCGSYADCLAALKAGHTIRYLGASGPVAFTASGDRSVVSVGVYSFGPDNGFGNGPTAVLTGPAATLR